jgi:hypothetical protein
MIGRYVPETYVKAIAISPFVYAAVGGMGVEFSKILRRDILVGVNYAEDFDSKPFSRFSLCQAMAKLINLSIKVNGLKTLPSDIFLPFLNKLACFVAM